MGCNCGKSFSNAYATGQRYRAGTPSHVPTQRPVSIQSKSLQAKSASQTQPVTQAAAATSGRRKV